MHRLYIHYLAVNSIEHLLVLLPFSPLHSNAHVYRRDVLRLEKCRVVDDTLVHAPSEARPLWLRVEVVSVREACILLCTRCGQYGNKFRYFTLNSEVLHMRAGLHAYAALAVDHLHEVCSALCKQ